MTRQMNLGEHATVFRQIFGQEILDNISSQGFIKKRLWDMQVGLINEEHREFFELQKKFLQTQKTLN